MGVTNTINNPVVSSAGGGMVTITISDRFVTAWDNDGNAHTSGQFQVMKDVLVAAVRSLGLLNPSGDYDIIADYDKVGLIIFVPHGDIVLDRG